MAIDKNLQSYTFTENESFIVDANVWIYLYSPFSTNTFGYEKFLYQAQNKKCRLFVNSQIISEYIHSICKTAYYVYLTNHNKKSKYFVYKKDYQQTEDFRKHFKLACESVKNDILSQSKILPIKLWHVRESLNHYNQMNDYNDLVYSKMLSSRIKIVSHDKDFGKHPDDIIWLHY